MGGKISACPFWHLGSEKVLDNDLEEVGKMQGTENEVTL